MKRCLALFVLTASLGLPCPAQNPGPTPAPPFPGGRGMAGPQIQVTADHADWNYVPGEAVKFTVTGPAGTAIQYTIGPEMMPAESKSGVLPESGALVLDGGTMQQPGFLRCVATAAGGGRGLATAAFSPERIKPTQIEPADFDAFWARAKAELAAIPMDAKVTPLPQHTNDVFEAFEVNLQNIGTPPAAMSRFYGVLCVPRGEGPFPAILSGPGAGVYPPGPETKWAAQGFITLNVGIHEIPVVQTPGEPPAARVPGTYPMIGLEDPNRYYFRRVFMGLLRAGDYLVQHPKWDRKNLIAAGGSQGGFLAMVTAALDPRVTVCRVSFPAYCDVTAYLHGRPGGWPASWFKFEGMDDPLRDAKIATTAYYDGVNFAKRIRVPGHYGWGYNDDTCPPDSTFAAYNVIPAPKQLAVFKEMGHPKIPALAEVEDTWLLKQVGKGPLPGPGQPSSPAFGPGRRGPVSAHPRDPLPFTNSSLDNLNPSLPTLFIAGDSTAATGNPQTRGWAALLVDYFDQGKVNLVNQGVGGARFNTYQGTWDRLMAAVKPGDYVVIELGHNSGPLPGVGDETQEVAGRGGATQVLHTHGWYLRKYIADVRAKKAIPIVSTITVRKKWAGGKVERLKEQVPGQGGMSDWSRQVAAAEKAILVDHTNIIADRYDRMGEAEVAKFFTATPTEYLHTNTAGAILNAEAFVAGLKALPNLPLLDCLNERGKAIPEYKPLPPASDRGGPGVPVSGGGPPGARGFVSTNPRDQLPFSNTSLTEVRPDLPTLFICGDSTAANENPRQRGWGALLIDYFDTGKVNLVNYSQGGINFPGYYASRWPQVVAALKPGDFVVVELGHNGGHLPGTGEETGPGWGRGGGQVHTFGWYVRQFIRDARAKGATAIVSTTSTRYLWTNPNAEFNPQNGSLISKKDNYNPAEDRVERGMGDVMPDGRRTMLVWAEQVAREEKAPFVDHSGITADLYEKTGREVVGRYHSDRTHTTTEGAAVNAETFIAGLKALSDMPLVDLLNDKGRAIEAYKPGGSL